MIANEVQYNLTRAQAARFEQALTALDAEDGRSASHVHPLLRQAEREAMLSQLASLREEVAEYESLRSGARRTFRAGSLDELAQVLIQARIASGLTQRELAERLGVKEQQVQRYEATGYSSASLRRIGQVARALNLEFREEATLGS